MTDRKQQVRWWFLLIATAIALYVCWLMLKPFVIVIAWAAVLVIVFYPVHKRIVARTRRPGLSALVSCVLVILIILVPLSLITLAVINELSGAVQNVQAGLRYVLDPSSRFTGPILRWLSRYVDMTQLQSDEYFAEQLKGMTGSIAGQALGFLGGLLGVVVQMFFVVFTMYYLFKDGEKISNTVRDAIPLERRQAEVVMKRTREVIDASVYGVFAVAIIQGLLGGVAFWVLGLPSVIIWTVAMTFLSMIPMLGAFVVWMPAAIYLAATGHWIKAIILVAWGTLVIGTIDNFLRPRLVGSRTRLHELIIFFAVLGGLQVFGVLGVVLGPVVVAFALAVLDIVRAAGDLNEA